MNKQVISYVFKLFPTDACGRSFLTLMLANSRKRLVSTFKFHKNYLVNGIYLISCLYQTSELNSSLCYVYGSKVSFHFSLQVFRPKCVNAEESYCQLQKMCVANSSTCTAENVLTSCVGNNAFSLFGGRCTESNLGCRQNHTMDTGNFDFEKIAAYMAYTTSGPKRILLDTSNQSLQLEPGDVFGVRFPSSGPAASLKTTTFGSSLFFASSIINGTNCSTLRGNRYPWTEESPSQVSYAPAVAFFYSVDSESKLENVFQTVGHENVLLSIGNSMTRKNDTKHVCLQQTITGLQLYSPEALPFAESVNFTVSTSHGSNVTYFWDFGDQSNATSLIPWVTHLFNSTVGSKTVTIIAGNDIGIAAAWCSVVIQERITGLHFESTFLLAIENGTTARIRWILFHGSHVDFNLTITYPDGSTEEKNLTNAKQPAAIFFGMYVKNLTQPGWHRIEITASNKVNNETLVGNLSVQRVVYGVVLDSAKILETNQTFNFTISQYQGDEVRYRLNTMDGKVVITTENVIPHVYTKAGRYRPTLITSNDISSVVVNCAEIIVQDLIEGLEYTSFNHTVAVRAEAEINWRLTQGSELYIIVDYGDGNSTIVNRSISVGDVFVAISRHNYTKPGEYHVTVNVTNLVDSEEINTTVYVETPGNGAVLAIRRGNLTIAGGDRCTGVLYVAVNDSVTATATVRNGTNLNGFLDFGDNSSERTRYFHGEFPDGGWTVHHSYSRAGEYNITVIFSNRNPKNDSHTCRIIVQNPVNKVMITTDSPRKKILETNQTFNFTISQYQGDEVRYRLNTMDGKVVNTTEKVIPHVYTKAGRYRPTLITSNDISSVVVNCAEIIVQDLIEGLEYTSFNHTVAVRAEAEINWRLIQGSELYIIVDYGDGNSTIVNRSVSVGDVFVAISRHNYTKPGKYYVTVNVTNLVDSEEINTTVYVETPVDGAVLAIRRGNLTVAGGDRCTGVLYVAVNDSVTATATVRNGSNVNGFLDFGDNSSERTRYFHREFPDGRWTVHHSYSRAGEYNITVIFSNRNPKNDSHTCRIIVQNPVNKVMITTDSPRKSSESNITFNISFPGSLQPSGHLNYIWRYGVQNFTPEYEVRDNRVENYRYPSKCGVYIATVNVSNEVSFGFAQAEVVIQDEVKDLNWTANYTELSVHDCNVSLPENVFPLDYNVAFNASANGTNVTYTWSFPGNEKKTGSSSRHKFVNTGKNNITLTAENAVSRQTIVITLELEQSILNVSIKNDGPSTLNQTVNFTLTAKEFGSDSCFNISFVDQDEENKYYKSGIGCSGQNATVISNSTRFHHRYDIVGEFDVSLDASNRVSCVKKITTVYVETPVDGAVLAIRRGNLTIAGRDPCTGVLYVAVNDSVTATATVRNGTNVNGFLDFGDNWSERTRYFHREFPDGGWTVHHSYSRAGEYNITVIFSNRNPKNDRHTCTIIVQNPVKDLNWTANYTELSVHDCSPSLAENVFPLDYNVSFNASANGTNVTYTWSFPGNENDTGSSSRHKFVYTGKNNITLTAENAVSRQTVVITLELEQSIFNVSLKNDGPSTQNQAVNFTLTAKEFGSDSCFNISFVDQDEENKYYKSGIGCSGQNAAVISNPTRVHHRYDIVGEFVVSLDASNRVSCVKKITTVYVETPVDGAVLAIRRGNLTIAGRDPCTGVLYVAVNDSVTATATVRNGTNVNGFLDFGDNSSERTRYFHREFPDGGWTVHHSYSWAGEYNITVIFSNRNPKNDSHTCRIIVQNPVNKVMITTDSPRKSSESNITFNISFPGSLQPSGHLNYIWRYGVQNFTPEYEVRDNRVENYRYPNKCGVYIATVNVSNKVSFGFAQAEVVIQDEVKDLNWTANYTELSVHDCSLSLPENVFPLDYNVSFNASANGTNVTYTWGFPGNGNKTGSSSMHKFVDTGKNNITLTAENAVSRQTVVITLELEQSILDISFKNDGPSTLNQTVNFTLTAREFGNNSCFQISSNQQVKEFYFKTGKGCYGQQANNLLRPTPFDYTYYNVGEFDVTLDARNRISCVKKVSKVAVARGVCNFPVIEVPGFDDGGIRKFTRSDKIIIKTNNKLHCFSYERKFEWTFSCEKKLLHLQNVNLASPEIIILPRTLEYCSHMEARFLINMTQAPGVYSEKTIVVSVTESPLNAIIDGGSEKTVGNKKPVKISAGESYDPDFTAGKPMDKNCTFAWFCQRKNDNFTLPESFTQLILAPVPTPPAINVTGNDSIDLGGCFRSGPGRLNFTRLEITLDATKMKAGTTYNITFVLGKRGRKLAYAHQVITIEYGDPPILNIK